MRFSLQTLMLATVLLALALAAFGAYGIVVAILLAIVAAGVRRQGPVGRDVLPAVMTALLALAFAAFLLLGSESFPGASPRMVCESRLQQLALALWEYHQDHACYPPAYIPDKNGKPMHSWRVLILPYLECGHIYRQYDFNEPWNGPHNRRLAAKIPSSVFQCPSSRSGHDDPTITNYLAVVDPNTAWPGAESSRLGRLESRWHDTVLLVEVESSGINWMEPKDLSLEEALAGVNADPGPGISSPHDEEGNLFRLPARGANVVTLDNSVHFLPEDVPREQLENLLRVDRAAAIPAPPQPRRPPVWRRVVALVGLFAVFAAYVWRRNKDVVPSPPGQAAPHDSTGASDQGPEPSQ